MEEKEVQLKRLQESDSAHKGEINKLNTALQQEQHLLVEHRREVQELNSQVLATMGGHQCSSYAPENFPMHASGRKANFASACLLQLSSTSHIACYLLHIILTYESQFRRAGRLLWEKEIAKLSTPPLALE